jgi:hypothetical protein
MDEFGPEEIARRMPEDLEDKYAEEIAAKNAERQARPEYYKPKGEDDISGEVNALLANHANDNINDVKGRWEHITDTVAQAYSDLYKAIYGMRPRLDNITVKEVLDFLENPPYHDHEDYEDPADEFENEPLEEPDDDMMYDEYDKYYED